MLKMIKIIIITPRLQHYRLSFYEKLSTYKNDYHLTVFYGINNKEDGKAGYKGETNFKSKGFKEFKFRVLPFEVVFNCGMYYELKKAHPDILIILASTGNITYRRIISWAKRKRKKVIIWTSGWDRGRAKFIMLALKNKLVSTFFQKADFFLTYSTNASRYVESMAVDKSKIEICYNGIETDDLIHNSTQIITKSNELIKKYDLESHITFLYVGGLIQEKRVDLLIDAFVKLHEKYDKIKLLIIGDGPLRPMVTEKLKIFSDPNILYLGRIIESVDPYFAASDCLVLPGAGGLALNQAMFWRKPCIVSKADGTEDDLVIEGITGYRFIENDLGSLVSAMERRINDNKEKVNILSENSHLIIQNKSNVNNMLHIFSNTIDKLAISGKQKENSK
jgi:glycosyltransferase involved in cell wall biosynthesis